MEKRVMENGTGTEAIEKSWDTDNLRLGIFLILFPLWARFQFIPLEWDTFCRGRETLYYFTLTLMLLALFLTKKRPPEEINRLGYLTACLAVICLIYWASDRDYQLPPWFHLPFLAGGFYFVKIRSHVGHVRNLILGALILLILFFILPNEPFKPDFYLMIAAISAVYIALKRREGLLRPAFFLLLLVTAHEGWPSKECNRIFSAPCSAAKSDLANLAIAEDAYFSENGAYSRNLRVFIRNWNFKPTKDVSIIVTHSDYKSYRILAFHPKCDRNQDNAPDYFYWDSANGGLQ